MYIFFFELQSECTKAGDGKHSTLTQRVRGVWRKKRKKEKRKLQKRATLVISYLHATPSNAFYDKVTASKKKKRHERENLCAKTHIRTHTEARSLARRTSSRCNKGGEQQGWREIETGE